MQKIYEYRHFLVNSVGSPEEALEKVDRKLAKLGVDGWKLSPVNIEITSNIGHYIYQGLFIGCREQPGTKHFSRGSIPKRIL